MKNYLNFMLDTYKLCVHKKYVFNVKVKAHRSCGYCNEKDYWLSVLVLFPYYDEYRRKIIG